MENTRKDTILSRRVAILAADGVDGRSLMQVQQALKEAGAQTVVVSKFQGHLRNTDGDSIEAEKSYVTTGSIMYDAVFVPGGLESVEALMTHGEAVHFINEAFKHCKAIGAFGEGVRLLAESHIRDVNLAHPEQVGGVVADKGVVTAPNGSELGMFVDAFKQAIARHRHWEREALKQRVPA